MLKIAELQGLWTRSMVAWPDGRRDTTTVVDWLQGQGAYADLRQTPGHAELFRHVRCLRDLTMLDCKRLALQQAFAGNFVAHGGDIFEWVRHADYQPTRPAKDIGRLYWQGDILIEEGLQAEYIEHWQRNVALPARSCAALTMADAADGRFGQLLHSGNMFMFVRDRAAPVSGTTLAAMVANALGLNAAQALVDFEISFGEISPGGWLITRSTLPFRENTWLHFARNGAGLSTDDIAPDGALVRRGWVITTAEGDTSIFLDGNH